MSNFDFLNNDFPVFAKLGALAEEYYEKDPVSSLIKLRTFAEFVAKELFYANFNVKTEASFSDILVELKPFIPKQLMEVFHIIRLKGNKATHENLGTQQDALKILEYTHYVACWFYLANNGNKNNLSLFVKPVSKLTIIEKELESARQEQEKLKNELENNIIELQKHKKSKEEIEEKIKVLETKSNNATQQTARVIAFTEAETRQDLIDEKLKEAGWDIRVVNDFKINIKEFDTQQVKREVPVTGLPNTPSGNGFVDYVLYSEDNKPIAIIEAKKTAVNVKKGREQAHQYANALERMTGFRPLIFCTNGFDIEFWDDVLYPPRKIYGYFSKDDVETRLYERKNRKLLEDVEINTDTISRDYQFMALRKTYEAFTSSQRKALVVMATGTGKTRTAMAIIDGLVKSNWVKRVLFLVDRDELRKQADGAFKRYLPNLSRVLINKDTKGDQNKRIYISTYPAMMQAYQLYTPGFFDLIVADESHRSVYNVYGEIFKYFDSFQIGLTATPVNYISRNTFTLFGTEDQNPTFNYDIDDAIEEGHLVPYKVQKVQTQCQDKGIKYASLTPEQKRALDEQVDDASGFDFEPEDLEKNITNKETNRKIIKTLMDEGLRDENGNLGKSIIFARSHKHGEILEELFNEMYPEYKGKYARLIDSHDPNASLLLDNFKGEIQDSEINIAISVAMLDTGVDVPEIMNLVFAKPIYSKVKFWQMIGRGTRLCENLLGPGKDKKYFVIFDHYENFEFFDENPEGYVPKDQPSLYERLFESRVLLAQTAKNIEVSSIYEKTIELIKTDIKTLPEKSVDVMDKARLINEVLTDELFWQNFDENFVEVLLTKIKPLMKRQKTSFETDKAMQFDIQVTQLELLQLQKIFAVNTNANADNIDDKIENTRLKIRKNAFELRTNINRVKAKEETIELVKNKDFGILFNYEELEKVRNDLRLLMKYKIIVEKDDMLEIDIPDDILINEELQMKLPLCFGEEYKHDIETILTTLADKNLVLQKIKKGKGVTDKDIESLVSIILEQIPHFSVQQLEKLYPEMASDLNVLIRNIVGIDEQEINQRIEEFQHQYTTLTTAQMQCLKLIKSQLSANKYIKPESFYDKPFTLLGSISDIFSKKQMEDIYKMLEGFIIGGNNDR